MFQGLTAKIIQSSQRIQLPRFEVRDLAPNTFADVVCHYRQTGYIVVYSGGSENTIYGDASTNYLSRAWHDFVHIKLGQGFDLAGETAVCLEQCRQVQSDTLALLFHAEIVSQAEYFFKTGLFPADQLQFIKGLL